MQNSSITQSDSASAGNGLPLKSKARRDMVEAGGRLCQVLGLPRSTGQIYGLLYLSPVPLSLDDIVSMLSISKGSASTGTRQLISWRAIRQVWVPGERRDFFEVIPDLAALIRASYADFLKPRLSASGKRLDNMNQALEEEYKEGLLTAEEHALIRDRLKTLGKLQKKMAAVVPLADKLL